MATPSHPAGPPATTDLRITVVGGGHVGLVSAVAFAALGNRVCVYDVDRARIDLLSAGKAPFVEPDVGAVAIDVERDDDALERRIRLALEACRGGERVDHNPRQRARSLACDGRSRGTTDSLIWRRQSISLGRRAFDTRPRC